MLIALAKSRSARGAPHQPAFISFQLSCLTIRHTCLSCLPSGRTFLIWSDLFVVGKVVNWERWTGSEVASWERWEGSEVARWERWESSEVARWGDVGWVQDFIFLFLFLINETKEQSVFKIFLRGRMDGKILLISNASC